MTKKMILAGATAVLLVGGVAVAQTANTTMNQPATGAQPYNQTAPTATTAAQGNMQGQAGYDSTMRAGERG